MDYSSLPIAVAVFASRLALDYDASREPAKHGAREVQFRPGRYLRWTLYSACAAPLLVVIDTVQYNRYAEMLSDLPWFLAFAAVFVAIGYGLPRTISVDDNGVRLAAYLGLGGRRVAWSGAHAVREPSTGKVYVCGADGTQIVHSKWHCARLAFVFQLEKRIKVY